jgi:hypothetical protein
MSRSPENFVQKSEEPSLSLNNALERLKIFFTSAHEEAYSVFRSLIFYCLCPAAYFLGFESSTKIVIFNDL